MSVEECVDIAENILRDRGWMEGEVKEAASEKLKEEKPQERETEEAILKKEKIAKTALKILERDGYWPAEQFLSSQNFSEDEIKEIIELPPAHEEDLETKMREVFGEEEPEKPDVWKRIKRSKDSRTRGGHHGFEGGPGREKRTIPRHLRGQPYEREKVKQSIRKEIKEELEEIEKEKKEQEHFILPKVTATGKEVLISAKKLYMEGKKGESARLLRHSGYSVSEIDRLFEKWLDESISKPSKKIISLPTRFVKWSSDEELQKFVESENIPILKSRNRGRVIYKEGDSDAEDMAKRLKRKFKDYISYIGSSKTYEFTSTIEEREPVLEINLILSQVETEKSNEIIKEVQKNGNFYLIKNRVFGNNFQVIQFEKVPNINEIMKKAGIKRFKREKKEIKKEDLPPIEVAEPRKYKGKILTQDDWKRLETMIETLEKDPNLTPEAKGWLQDAKAKIHTSKYHLLQRGDAVESMKYFKEAEKEIEKARRLIWGKAAKEDFKKVGRGAKYAGKKIITGGRREYCPKCKKQGINQLLEYDPVEGWYCPRCGYRLPRSWIGGKLLQAGSEEFKIPRAIAWGKRKLIRIAKDEYKDIEEKVEKSVEYKKKALREAAKKVLDTMKKLKEMKETIKKLRDEGKDIRLELEDYRSLQRRLENLEDRQRRVADEYITIRKRDLDAQKRTLQDILISQTPTIAYNACKRYGIPESYDRVKSDLDRFAVGVAAKLIEKGKLHGRLMATTETLGAYGTSFDVFKSGAIDWILKIVFGPILVGIILVWAEFQFIRMYIGNWNLLWISIPLVLTILVAISETVREE